MRSTLLLALLGVGGLALWSPSARAKIVALDLPGMIASCDDAVHGTVVAQRVFRVDHPIDGPELFFTTITLAGRSLGSGDEVTVDLTFPGGFVTPEEGVYNSESPQAQEVALGSEVVAFHDWTDNMGGDVAGHAIVAAHGGLYTVQENRRGERIVLGRGPGYAVSENVELEALRGQIQGITRELRETTEQEQR